MWSQLLKGACGQTCTVTCKTVRAPAPALLFQEKKTKKLSLLSRQGYWLLLFLESEFLFAILAHWLINLSYKSRENDQARQICALCSYPISTHPPLVVPFIPPRWNLHLCSKPTFCKKKNYGWLGTGACSQTDTRPADHWDIISCCHNTFSLHFCLGALSIQRLLSAPESSPMTMPPPPLRSEERDSSHHSSKRGPILQPTKAVASMS